MIGDWALWAFLAGVVLYLVASLVADAQAREDKKGR